MKTSYNLRQSILLHSLIGIVLSTSILGLVLAFVKRASIFEIVFLCFPVTLLTVAAFAISLTRYIEHQLTIQVRKVCQVINSRTCPHSEEVAGSVPSELIPIYLSLYNSFVASRHASKPIETRFQDSENSGLPTKVRINENTLYKDNFI